MADDTYPGGTSQYPGPPRPRDESAYNGWNTEQQQRHWWMLMPKIFWKNSHFGGDPTVWPYIEWQPWRTPRPPSHIDAIPVGEVVPVTKSVLWQLVPRLIMFGLWVLLSGWLLGVAMGHGSIPVITVLIAMVLGLSYFGYRAWYAFLVRQIALTTIGHSGIFVIQQAIYKPTGANIEPSAIKAPTWEYPSFWYKLCDVGTYVFTGPDPESDKESKRYTVEGISHPERFAALTGTLQIELEAEQLRGARASTKSVDLLGEGLEFQRQTLAALRALQQTSGRDQQVASLLDIIANLQAQVSRLQTEADRGGRPSPQPRSFRPESRREDPTDD